MSLLGRKRLALGVLAGAAASLVLMWVLFDPTDASRVYYGTETHAAGLLIGVALALVWAPWQLQRAKPGRWCGPVLDALGVLALAYLVLSFLRVHDYDLALYHGGYLWIALASAAVIAVFAHPAARLGGLVARPPPVWLGLRSYSFYLWHWPVLALTRPGLDVSLPRGVLIPLQLLVVLALADLSYRFVELPLPRQTQAAGIAGELAASGPARARLRGGCDHRAGRLEPHLLDRRQPPPTRRRRRLNRRIRQGSRSSLRPLDMRSPVTASVARRPNPAASHPGSSPSATR
jgi:peptidoglycan/LPS O-acetylase OafA/YrhL